METMTIKLMVPIIACTLFSASVSAQQNVPTTKLVSKLREIRENLEDLSNPDPVVTEKKNALRLSINDMILRLDRTNKPFPDAYAIALDQLVAESNQLVTLSTKDQVTELDYLSNDLSLKFRDRTNTLGQEIYSNTVPLTVIWNKGNANSGKYRVRYSGSGFKFDATKPSGMLGAITSPVKDSLIPGLYKIWLTNPNDYVVIQMWEGEIAPEKNNVVEFDVP